MEKGVLLVKNNSTTVMEGRLDKHNVYYVTLNNNMITTFIQDHIMAASTSKSLADIVIWHCHFAHLNAIYLKQLLNMTSGMKILLENSELLFCFISIQSKMIRQTHYNLHTSSNILGFCIYLDVGRSANIYTT